MNRWWGKKKKKQKKNKKKKPVSIVQTERPAADLVVSRLSRNLLSVVVRAFTPLKHGKKVQEEKKKKKIKKQKENKMKFVTLAKKTWPSPCGPNTRLAVD